MGNKVKKSRQRRGWRKTKAKRLHEEMKARKLQTENVEDKENTHVASVNVPVVDISLKNKFVSSDDERERQLLIENFEDEENTVALVNVPVVGTSLRNKESSDGLVRVIFMDDTDSKIYQTLGLMPITPEQNSCLPVDGEIDSDMTYSHRENIAMNSPFDEIQKLQPLAAVTRTQDNSNHSKHHSPADSDSEEDYYTIEPEEELEEIRISGNRVVDFMYLLEQLQEIVHHNSPLDCNFNYLKLVSEKRKGFVSKFQFVCKMCNTKLSLQNFKTSNNKKELDLNENVVSSFMAIGSGYAGLEQVSASLEIPSMSDHYYAKCHAKVCELWETAKEKCMAEAAKEEYDLAVRDGNVNTDGVPMITVVANGCWSKRSYKKNYNASSGAAVIIGYKTKKVLYMAVKNKYCMICARSENKNVLAPDHTCYKNYNSSSSGMESVAIVEGFKHSLPNQGLIYSKLIADGGSSTYKSILEAKPYGNLLVEKIECTNHLLRNFCTKLEELTKNTCYPIKYRKLLGKNILRLRRSIKGAVKYNNSKDSNFNQKVIDLKQDLINAPNHVFVDHKLCKPYFCQNIDQNEPTENFVAELKSSNIFAAIMKIMSRLVNNAKSLIHDVNSNIAEVFNSVVAIFVGGKRINYSSRQSYTARCAGSVVSFNAKESQSYICRKILMRSPNPIVKKLELKRNKKRIADLRRRLSKSFVTKKCTNNVNDKYYGDSCQKPDLEQDDFDFAKSEHIKKIHLSDEDRQSLEKRTILQADSIEWHQERKLRLTASAFGKVCKRGLIKCAPLVKTLLNVTGDLSHVKSVRYGKEHEHIALEQLAEVLKLDEEANFNGIQKCGLFVDPELPFLAASPDGVIGDKIIEVKCPYLARDMMIREGIAQKKISFWKLEKNGNLTINKHLVEPIVVLPGAGSAPHY